MHADLYVSRCVRHTVPAVRADAYKTRRQVAYIYIRAPSHVNRIVGFIELHWQRSNDKEKLSRTDGGGEKTRDGGKICVRMRREREGESRGEETRGRRKETRSTLDSKMHIAPR